MNSYGLQGMCQRAPNQPTVCTFGALQLCGAWLTVTLAASHSYTLYCITKRKSSWFKNEHRMVRTKTLPLSEHISTSDNNKGFPLPLCDAFFFFFLLPPVLSCCVQQSYTTSQWEITDCEWTLNGRKQILLSIEELSNMERIHFSSFLASTCLVYSFSPNQSVAVINFVRLIVSLLHTVIQFVQVLQLHCSINCKLVQRKYVFKCMHFSIICIVYA